MTNIGIIHPDPGYHNALRALTRKHGALLIIDETHTICAGPGGYTAAYGLTPDLLTIGKPIGGGVPGAVYGFSAEVATQLAGTDSAGRLRHRWGGWYAGGQRACSGRNAGDTGARSHR